MKKFNFNDYIPEELVDNESCRLITTEQYREYLKLKEEHKPLSWEELKEEAKKMGYIYVDNDTGTYLFNPDKSVSFCRNGCFVADSGMIGGDVYISSNRSYDQMFAIMKALQ